MKSEGGRAKAASRSPKGERGKRLRRCDAYESGQWQARLIGEEEEKVTKKRCQEPFLALTPFPSLTPFSSPSSVGVRIVANNVDSRWRVFGHALLLLLCGAVPDFADFDAAAFGLRQPRRVDDRD